MAMTHTVFDWLHKSSSQEECHYILRKKNSLSLKYIIQTSITHVNEETPVIIIFWLCKWYYERKLVMLMLRRKTVMMTIMMMIQQMLSNFPRFTNYGLLINSCKLIICTNHRTHKLLDSTWWRIFWLTGIGSGRQLVKNSLIKGPCTLRKR